MKKENVFTFFNSRFRAVSRPLREQILCAMIRVNYDTLWDGDQDLLKNFFPEWYHKNLVFGGLTHLIEALSPQSDEPTDHGIVIEEPTILDGDLTGKANSETTSSFAAITADVPLVLEHTISIRIS